MIDLHLIEVPLDLRALHVWAETRGLALRGTLDEGRVLHHLLGEMFGPGAVQPFRLMAAPSARRAALYAYSSQPAEALRSAAAAIATPATAEILDPARLRSLPRPAASWRMGQRLGFDLRARPVTRLASRAGELKKGTEIDAFVAEALRSSEGDPEGMAAVGRSREAVYLDWLAARLEGAAEIEREATRLVRFQRERVVRNGRLIEGPDATFHGTLTVTDRAAFAEKLARGLGRHRAYGYGMLLLRPPQRC